MGAASLAPAVEAHLQHLAVERRLAPRTLVLYRDALARLQENAAREGVALEAAAPHHLRGWAARLRGSGLAPRSIALVLSAWRGLYRHWGRLGLVQANPVDGLRAPKAGRPLPKALSVEQAVQLAEHARVRAGGGAGGGGDVVPAGGSGRVAGSAADEAPQPPGDAIAPLLALRDHAIVELLYGSGLRVAEILGLDLRASGEGQRVGRGWIDLADASAHVLGKGHKRRSVPVGREALAALQAWIGARAQLANGDEPALFVSRLGSRLSAPQLRLRLKAQARAGGLAVPVHPHMLRHSFASHLLQSSGDLRAVQELLGHASITTTQVYTRLDHQHLAKVYDAAHPRAKRKGTPGSG